jgi:hypothetical protein
MPFSAWLLLQDSRHPEHPKGRMSALRDRYDHAVAGGGIRESLATRLVQVDLNGAGIWGLASSRGTDRSWRWGLPDRSRLPVDGTGEPETHPRMGPASVGW